jgi:predicted MFS family arabinose efflux permease
MSQPASASPPLDAGQRARGRRLAIASHPFGMTFQTVFTQSLPTLALVALGASETLVGVQSALVQAALLLQLPTLLAVARVRKRTILVCAHGLALAAALPLLAFGGLARAKGGVELALASLAVVAVGIGISNTVWFPMLRALVERDRIGRFFGTLRTGWHLTLIVYFLASREWLARHPGEFGPLFAAAWVCGALRVLLISRLPERSERSGERIRVGELFALARTPAMRAYLAGTAWSAAARTAALPFAVVMLRRELGLTDAEVVLTSVATYAGGLVSLYFWGRAVDRIGAAPVFRLTALGMGSLLAALALLGAAGALSVPAAVAIFFAHAALFAGFGVADTHVLFELAPEHAPSRAVVLAAVCVGLAAGLAPALAGRLLDAALASGRAPLDVYRAFFLAAGSAQALAFLPLRRFARAAAA